MFNRLFQWIGRLRLPLWIRTTSMVEIGVQETLDAIGSTRWREFTTAESLFDVWAPVSGSTWEAYHCATLFAALDQIPPRIVGAAPESWFPDWLRHELPVPKWLDVQTWLILDAPGYLSVAIAAQLAPHRVCQTVCTFDNWPHFNGLVKPELVLAALIRYSTSMEIARRGWSVDLPPVWICDSLRLGNKPGRPRDFDNRYFLDDSILPGPDLLKQHGIQRIVYGNSNLGSPPTADLTGYLDMLIKQGLPVFQIGLDSMESWRAPPVPMTRIPQLPFKSTGFFRSTAGGFGSPIPEPSSSSG